jgi:Winged helix-turn helix
MPRVRDQPSGIARGGLRSLRYGAFSGHRNDQGPEDIRAMVGVLELAGNVSQACKMTGYSRDNFHRFEELYDKGGELALQEIARRKPILKNVWRRRSRTPWSRLSLTKPARGKVRVANELLKRGMSVSPFRRPLHLEPARSHDNEASGKPGAVQGHVI